MIEYTDGIGIAAVRSIKRLAARDDGPERTKNTWNSIKNGLQLSDEEEFSIVDMVKLEKAWNAYEAYGVAPSKKLQPYFDDAAARANESGFNLLLDLPSKEVIGAFDHMLATDAEIEEKRANAPAYNEGLARKHEDRESGQRKRQDLLANNNGMRRWDGLYHGNRRVRATIMGENWVLASVEKDLIEVLGLSLFSVKVNRADLRKRAGLEIKRERAPTIAIEDYPYWRRTDEWGSGAEPYRETLAEKIGVTSVGDVIGFLLCFHFVIAFYLSSRLTSRWLKIIVITACIGFFPATEHLHDVIDKSGWTGALISLGWLYAWLPFGAGALHMLLHDNSLPAPKK
jgi:hypothetical protein